MLTRVKKSMAVVGLCAVGAACSGGGSDSSASSVPDSAVEVVEAVGSTESPAIETTEAPPSTDATTTTEAATTTEAQPAAPESPPVLYGGDELAPGATGSLAYMSLDSVITVTAPDAISIFSATGAGGTGWVNLVAGSVDGPQVAVLANSLATLHTEDPTFTGEGASSLVAVPEDLVEWIAARPFLASAESGTVELGNLTGTYIDYEIGDLAGTGHPCADPVDDGKTCASMLAFGSYLRGFPAGEKGSVYDVTDGSTRLIVLTLGAEGDDVASTLNSTPRTPPENSIGPAIAAGGLLAAATSYAVPDVLDGLNVGFTVGDAGGFARLEPGWVAVYESPDAAMANLAVFRGDLMHWNPDLSDDPYFPFEGADLSSATSVEFATAADRLAGSGLTVTAGPTETTVAGYPAVRFTLEHSGPGLDRCAAPCVAPMFSSAGRTPLVEEGTPRSYVVVDVDGQPLVLAVVGDTGESLLATLAISTS